MKKTLLLVSALALIVAGLVFFLKESKGNNTVIVFSGADDRSSSQSSSSLGLQLPIDPSVCKNNPEGYVYFKVGEETFRYTKYSPIQLGSVKDRNSSNSDDIATPKGCAGNPYTDFVFKYKYFQGANSVGDIEFDKFRLIEVPLERYEAASPGQEIRENSYYRKKSNGGLCDVVTENLFRCAVQPDNPDVPQDEWAVSYLSDNAVYSTVLGRPFALDCMSNVVDLLCEAYYRLYPSVDFTYAYYSKEIEPENILLFDQYLRQLFEDMRVKN